MEPSPALGARLLVRPVRWGMDRRYPLATRTRLHLLSSWVARQPAAFSCRSAAAFQHPAL